MIPHLPPKATLTSSFSNTTDSGITMSMNYGLHDEALLALAQR